MDDGETSIFYVANTKLILCFVYVGRAKTPNREINIKKTLHDIIMMLL